MKSYLADLLLAFGVGVLAGVVAANTFWSQVLLGLS